MSLRVGADLALIDTVRGSIGTHAEHDLERVRTRRELDHRKTARGSDPERRAARRSQASDTPVR